MKHFACLLFLMLVAGLAYAQTSNPNYDAELAERLNADDYGMKSYVFVMLKTGPNTSTDQEAMSKAFAGHMENMGRMAEAEKLIVAGPMGKNDKAYRGIFILDVPTMEEAEALLQTDPAIKAEYLQPELFEWYGSAALPEYLPAHDKIWKKDI